MGCCSRSWLAALKWGGIVGLHELGPVWLLFLKTVMENNFWEQFLVFFFKIENVGKRGVLNVGAVLILLEGFELAPFDYISP